MENVLTTQVSDSISALVATRNNLVKGLIKTGDLIQAYADNMCMVFNVKNLDGSLAKPWFELKGKERAGVKAERDSFVSACTEAGFGKGTIDVYWQRVKEASGYITSGNRVQGASSTDDKTLTELKTIINRIFKAEEAGEDCKASDYKGDLMDIFQALGGNVDNLG